jgi:hypothetical protein
VAGAGAALRVQVRDVCRGFLSASVDRPRLSRIPSFLREVGGIAVHPSMPGRMRSHYLATIGTTGHFNLVELRGIEPLTSAVRLRRSVYVNL